MSEKPKGLGPGHVTKLALCLKCGEHLDRMSGVAHGRAPKPNDITICIRCAYIMAVADDLGLRKLTPEEKELIAHDNNVKAAVIAVRIANLMHPRKPDPKGN